jgi:enamine deaminase RidA (YjgF/YER057c/UK114 family)
MTLERGKTAAYGPGGNIVHQPFVRAGKWVFGTGLRANRPDGLMDPAVVLPGHPLTTPPQAQREAGAIFAAMAAGLEGLGSGLGHVARLDQYYSDALHVDPYHVARKQALAGQVAPSTSVIVGGLLNLDASMDVQVMAATAESGYTASTVGQDRLNVPSTSGYVPCLRMGDMLFVAGQLARDASGAIAAEAMLPPGQLWSGTRIKLETRYIVQQRLAPALEAGGSGLDLVLKAQVYLSREADFPAFWQAWSEAFGGRIPPTTVVPVAHPAFGTREATIEVNIVAAHASARAAVHDIRCDGVPLVGPGALHACRFDDLLFVSGLMALGPAGLADVVRSDPSAPFFQDAARAQMADILAKARTIFAAAGSDLSQVVRALHFHTDLADFPRAHGAWTQELGGLGLPFGAVQAAPGLFVPGARLIVDLWGYAPG